MNPDEKEILMIPVQGIRVANPRVRERRKFEQIDRSIAEQGLKRPITVTETKPGPAVTMISVLSAIPARSTASTTCPTAQSVSITKSPYAPSELLPWNGLEGKIGECGLFSGI